MADLVVANRSDIVAIADAIRSKTGESGGMTLPQMAGKVSGISGTEDSELLNSLIDKTIKSISNEKINSIEKYTFAYCENLTSVDFPSVTIINENAFTHCKSLSSFNFSTITNVGKSAFENCGSLISIDFPSITTVGNSTFADCVALKSVNLPSVTNIEGHAFLRCTALTTIDLPLVETIRYSAFSNCTNMNSINMPLLVEIGESAFNNCGKLTDVNFPNVVSVGANAFDTCIKLTSADFSSVTSLGENAFLGCRNLNELILRTNTVVSLKSSNILKGTKIEKGSGYIYVPENLVDSYKTNKYWSSYTNQIKPIGWSEDSIEIVFYIVCDDLGIQETRVSNTSTWASYIDSNNDSHLTYDSYDGGNVYYDGYMIYENDTMAYPDFNDNIINGATYVVESGGPC